MRDLAESGAIERRRKGGTSVRRDPVTRATLDIPITRLEIEQRGAVYGYQLIRSSQTQPPLGVASRFGLRGQASLLRIEALHLADHRPYIFEDRWICQATVPEIDKVDLSQESANEWLVRHKPFSRCDLRFYARKTDARLSEILDTEHQEAVFVMERTTWINDDPITSVTAVTHPGYQLLTTI